MRRNGRCAVVLSTLVFSLSTVASHVWADRVATNPYASVDWENDFQLKTQFHDHPSLRENRYVAYDQAGYDVVSLMNYSGDPSLAQAWTERRWPPEDWLSDELLNSFENIRFLIPNAEERSPGIQHIVSPFLTTYIEHWDPAIHPEKLPYHHQTAQEAIDLINLYGGLSIVAHPVGGNCCPNLTGYHAAEVFNAFFLAKWWQGVFPTDQNSQMLDFWDRRLMENPTLYGVAVNDHFGPWQFIVPTWIRDSGKTIVIAHEANMDSLREAVKMGAMFAVKDIGDVKDQYPSIDSISIAADVITINTTGNVNWISNAMVVGTNPSFDTSTLTPDARYIRAEISNEAGSTVYTQPWSLVQPSTWDGSSGNWSDVIHWDSDPLFPDSGNGGIWVAIVNAGTVTLDQPISIEALRMGGGTLTGNFDLVSKQPSDWTGGTMSGSGTTTFNRTVAVDTTNTPLLLERTLEITAGATVGGTGDFQVQNGATIRNQIGSTFTIQGDVLIKNAGNPISTFVNGGTLVNATGTNTIEMIVNNTGTIRVKNGILRLTESVTQHVDTTLTGGTWQVLDNATLEMGSDISVNDAEVTLSGQGSSFAAIDTLTTNNGALRLLNNRDFTAVGAVLNTGALEIGGGTFDATTLDNVSTGEISGFGTVDTPNDPTKPVINNGNITGNSLAKPITLSGYVTGAGTCDNCNITGTDAPGINTAAVNRGSVSYNGTVEIEIGGTTPGSGHDQINHILGVGVAELGGTLDIQLINDFVPIHNESFPIMNYASRSGDFDAFTGVLVNDDFTLVPTAGATTYTLTAEIPGDSDLNGIVNFEDFLNVANNFNAAGTVWGQGNFDLNGLTNFADFVILTNNYGADLRSGVSAQENVPEPASLVLLSLAISFVAKRRCVDGRWKTGAVGCHLCVQGLRTPIIPCCITCVYIIVVRMSLCLSSLWTVRIYCLVRSLVLTLSNSFIAKDSSVVFARKENVDRNLRKSM